VLDSCVLCRMVDEVVIYGVQLRTKDMFGGREARGCTRGLVMKRPARHLVKAGVCRQAIWDDMVNALQGFDQSERRPAPQAR
jgi:hypothetical protein